MTIDLLLLGNSWMLKSTLILLVVLLFNKAFGATLSASFRHLIWLTGFLGMLLTPVISSLSSEMSSTISLPITTTSSTIINTAITNTLPNSNFPKTIEGYASQLRPVESANKRMDWGLWLSYFWYAGIIILLSRLVIEKLLLIFLRLKSKAGSSTVRALLLDCQQQIGLNRTVKLRSSSHIDTPFTTGWIKPKIYLPAGFEHFESQKQRFVLLHEIAHIQRLDSISSFVQQLASTVFWFNPVVWLATRYSKLDMEKACDDRVIRATNQKYDYASLILDVIELSNAPAWDVKGRLTMASKNELRSRMTSILDDHLDRNRVNRRTLFLVAMLTLLILVPLASMRMVIDGPPDQPINKTIDHYIQLLDSGSENDQKYAAWALGSSENSKAAAALVGQLDHANPEVRSVVLWALGELKVHQTLPALIRTINDQEPLVREMAAKAIGELENTRGIAPLRSLSKDPSVGVRTAAIWALGEINTQKSLKLVREALSDPANEVVTMALRVLGQTHCLKAVPQIALLLQTNDIELKVAAIKALDQMHFNKTMPYLTTRLSDENELVRTQAAKALGNLGNKEALPFLMPLLQDSSVAVREMAVWALDELQF